MAESRQPIELFVGNLFECVPLFYRVVEIGAGLDRYPREPFDA